MKIYLLMNLALCVSLSIFCLSEGACKKLKFFFPFQFMLRIGQTVILISLVLPLITSFLPRERHEVIPQLVLVPLNEFAAEVSRKIPDTMATMAPPAPNKVPTVVFTLDYELMVVVLLGLSLLAAVGKKTYLWLTLARELKSSILVRSLGRVRIIISPQFAVPFSTLLGNRAWIALPEHMVLHWKDFKLAVLHELQHHRQKDTLWAIVIEAMTALFWWNPAIYLWKRRISELQELSCDEALIGRNVSSYDYGSCLVRVAEAALGNSHRLVGTAGMAGVSGHPKHFKSVLKRRIEMLIEKRKVRGRLGGLAQGTLAVLSAFAVCYALETTASSAKSDEVTAGTITVEAEVQKIAESALKAAIKRHKASLGFVVVSDPNTGRVLAVANVDKVETDTDRTPHWALGLRIGPASISKAFATSMAIEKKLTRPDEILNCEKGHYEYGGKTYRDWKKFDHLTTAEMVIQSSNVCGIKIGEKLGVKGLQETFARFGFGPGGSAEAFPEARVAQMPDPSQVDPKWYIATAATGYSGMFVSPIEMVQAFGAIANGGTLLKPKYGNHAIPEKVGRVISEETSQKMKEILAQVLITGTARESGSKLYHLAGKTATGYSTSHVNHDSLGGDSNFASFIGFGPVENPQVLVYVGIENPTDGKGVHGSYHAAPVFREVAERTLAYLKVPVQK